MKYLAMVNNKMPIKKTAVNNKKLIIMIVHAHKQ